MRIIMFALVSLVTVWRYLILSGLIPFEFHNNILNLSIKSYCWFFCLFVRDDCFCCVFFFFSFFFFYFFFFFFFFYLNWVFVGQTRAPAGPESGVVFL